MKKIYECELCNRKYENSEEAVDCENSHIIIKPKYSWIIPVYGFIAATYSIIRSKRALIVFDNTFMSEILRTWIFMSPIFILMLLLLYLSVVFK